MPSREFADLSWLVSSFSRKADGVRSAAVVSADGLLLAMSDGIERAQGDQLAAITSGLASLTRGAASVFDAGAVDQVMVEMSDGFLFVMSISDGSSLAVQATTTCDLGLVAYEMSLLVSRAGAVLTPELRRELQAALPGLPG